ncbi:polyketide synthase [Aspergillus luchuensis]|uniref:Polyketide synthase n=1 Tax=Aspergillus kawachii TaxID=1069201 RepID=A0A146FG32_ASPKA|nr:polyketide synthase [Aspergillus luchuensis]
MPEGILKQSFVGLGAKLSQAPRAMKCQILHELDTEGDKTGFGVMTTFVCEDDLLQVNSVLFGFTIEPTHHDQNPLDGKVSCIDLEIGAEHLPEMPEQSRYSLSDSSILTTLVENIQWPVTCLPRRF